MIRIINSVVAVVISFGIFSGVQLYNIETSQNYVPKDKIPAIEKKIERPKEAPKLLNQKLLKQYEMIDSIESALTEHIINVLNKNKYNCLGRNKVLYAQELASAFMQHTKGDVKLLLWVASIARVESSYRLTADPKVSSARGYMQVIYKYHQRDLKKLGISQNDIYTDTSKSVLAGIAVFRKYLKAEHGNFERATRRYRGLSVSEKQQKYYLNEILKEEKEIKRILSQYA